mgnify:CR=1 FL=1|jgi:DNA integrity scanning protein DisA with diadenylate cyclase activity
MEDLKERIVITVSQRGGKIALFDGNKMRLKLSKSNFNNFVFMC